MKILITERQLEKLIGGFLNEDFKSQKKKFIEQGNDEYIVDKYLNDFREIKDKKFKELENVDLEGLNVEKGLPRYDIDKYKTFKEVELVVDYISGQRKVGSKNFQDIQVDGKPIYNDENVEIYYAPNKESCIRYKGNKSYSWCIARSDASNMFMRYRTNTDRPSFYFVKRKSATAQEFDYWNNTGESFTGQFNDKYHFFVIQVLKDGSYIVTSATNDGDIKMTWDDILNIAPELEGKKNYFKSKPLSDVEIEKYNKYKKRLSDDEFFKLPYIEKEYYIDTVVDLDNELTYKQFWSLPEDLKNKYINLGIKLTPLQLELIKDNKNLINRYKEVSINKDVDEIITLLDMFDEAPFMVFNVIKQNVLRALKENEESPINPNLSKIKKYVSKEKITNNVYYTKYLFFLSLSKSSETMIDLMEHLGIDYKKFINSLNKEELDFYNELTYQ